MKVAILSNALVKNRAKKALFQKAYLECGYYRTPKLEKYVQNSTNIIGPLTLYGAKTLSDISQPGNIFQNVFIGTMVSAAYMFRNVAVRTHKAAVKSASELAIDLTEKGFSKAEREIIIKDHLSTNGNMLFGRLFKMIYPKRVEKLAEGTPTKSGFLVV